MKGARAVGGETWALEVPRWVRIKWRVARLSEWRGVVMCMWVYMGACVRKVECAAIIAGEP